MAFTDKDDAVNNLNSNITSPTEPHLTPTGGDNKVRASNLKQWINEFLDWITPVSGSDLRRKSPVVTGVGTNYSSISWQEIIPVGTIMPWAGASSSPPDGYLFCDGNTYSSATYSDLSAVLGTNYNGGAVPAGTFRTPNLEGRVPLGFESGSSTTPNTNPSYSQNNYGKVGNTGGSPNVTLSNSQIPSHIHNPGTYSAVLDDPAFNEYGLVKRSSGVNTVRYTDNTPGEPELVSRPRGFIVPIKGSSGGKTGASDLPHENRTPYVVVKYIIKT